MESAGKVKLKSLILQVGRETIQERKKGKEGRKEWVLYPHAYAAIQGLATSISPKNKIYMHVQ